MIFHLLSKMEGTIKLQVGGGIKMPNHKGKEEKPWNDLHGPNLAYILEQYEIYSKNPESVDSTLKSLFEEWGSPITSENKQPKIESDIDVRKVISAEKLVQYIRTYGHLSANINPLTKNQHSLPNHGEYGLNEEDLNQIPAELIWTGLSDNIRTAQDVIQHLQTIYTESLAYEFSHVHNQEEREWLYSVVESRQFLTDLTTENRSDILKRLIEVDEFEKFLQRTFTGQKRFSIEGVDMLVPMIDELIRASSQVGVRHVMMGMAHRGRLNVLAHILGKPYEKIFSEFHHSTNKEVVPSEGSMGINYGWTGDVKYHLGGNRDIDGSNSVRTRVTLANNPSHLEFVDPVVEGFTRAVQEDRTNPGYPQLDTSKAIALLIHGDAAFPGEGVVAETLNLSQLTGYRTGGTIHIIANNQLGFTTDHSDSRSTTYSSDLAKGFEIPIVHVNADDPEACLAAIRLACEYRTRFQKDFLIDLIGYRRFGHNEMDDPTVTQPLMYEIIQKHPTIRTQYAEKLSEKWVDATEIKTWEANIKETLQSAHEKMKEETDNQTEYHSETGLDLPTEINTGVSIESLKAINHALLERPKSFNAYPKLERTLSRRISLLDEEEKVDWALAETLAFATILSEGTAIRFTGQDTERGTFAHRHLVLHDSKTGKTFSPLHSIPQAKAAFGIHNSPLSETSVLGFEYGYNFFAPNTLTLWEAQYGDFANAGQVIIDQFLSAGRAKWRQNSSLVMLLPHGYEGQGPEHSSARLERYLQLAAENNVVIANLSSAAQYFHLLRRQAAMTGKEEARPLILMAPKSLIRSKRTVSPSVELETGSFQAIKEETGLGKKSDQVKRLILCSGKIAIDLSTELEAMSPKQKKWLHILRVEQLYPFPKKEIQSIMNRYKHLEEVIWVQEEPKNMGAWTFMESRIRETVSDQVSIRYIGRPDRSSPATGKSNVHDVEQQRILTDALHHKS
jgi:2-oxoglutarate dehydrogenase E1 component